MGAIAVSEKEERQIKKLSKQLKIPTKSGVIRAALKTLEEKVEKERLRQEIQESVRRCAAADKEENRHLFAAAVARNFRKE